MLYCIQPAYPWTVTEMFAKEDKTQYGDWYMVLWMGEVCGAEAKKDKLHIIFKFLIFKILNSIY